MADRLTCQFILQRQRMQSKREDLTEAYDRNYLRPNYFAYREGLYRPYLKALVKKARLKKGSSVLDAGCGQGFFTWLFADLGFTALGVDISGEGIRAAQREYGSSRAHYVVGDVRRLEFHRQFDCVFTRSCSLFNSEAFQNLHDVTNALLTYVAAGGILIFDYYTKLSRWKASSSWVYHSLSAVQKHFSHYPQAEVFFSLRFDSIILGRLAFTYPVSSINATISRCTGIGGELVAFVRKE
jgi:SAM-dependent methyltransferase